MGDGSTIENIKWATRQTIVDIILHVYVNTDWATRIVIK